MTDKTKITKARLQCYEFIFQNNSIQFHAYSLTHALTRIDNDFKKSKEDGTLLEVILPDQLRLRFSWKLFIVYFLNHHTITEEELISRTQTREIRKIIKLNYVLPSTQTKAKHIRDSEGWDELLPIQFVHWFGEHYAMFIGETNTRWFYDISTGEID